MNFWAESYTYIIYSVFLSEHKERTARDYPNLMAEFERLPL